MALDEWRNSEGSNFLLRAFRVGRAALGVLSSLLEKKRGVESLAPTRARSDREPQPGFVEIMLARGRDALAQSVEDASLRAHDEVRAVLVVALGQHRRLFEHVPHQGLRRVRHEDLLALQLALEERHHEIADP